MLNRRNFIRAIASTAGVASSQTVMPAARAATHVCAVIPNLLYQEWANCAPEDNWEQDLICPPTQIEKGHVILPNGLGLGFELNEKLVNSKRI